VVDNDRVKVVYGDPVDQSINHDDSYGRRFSPAGEIISGDNLVKTENWDAANRNRNLNRSAIDADGNNYHNRQSYGKLREEGDDHFEQLKKQKNSYYPAPEFTFIMKEEKDCIDTAFDNIESYGCKDSAGDIFPAGVPPLSSEASYELQQALDGRLLSCDANGHMEEKMDEYDVLEKNSFDKAFDGIESYGCQDTAGEVFPAGASHLSSKDTEQLQQTLDGKFLSCGANEYEQTSSSSDPIPTGCCADNKAGPGYGIMAGVIVNRLLGRENESSNQTTDDPVGNDLEALHINRENSILDVESLEERRQNRLEQLRQSKRAIEEKHSLGFGKNHTIVIPRDALYESRDENNVDVSEITVSKLQVGTPVTDKQTTNYFLRRKLVFIGTLMLISIGVVIFAVALFWPARQL